MFRLTHIQPLDGFCLALRFEDGSEGQVDLSDLAGQGVFAAWNEPGVFEKVAIGSGGEATWACGVDLCSDSLYMQVTGQKPEEVFPSLAKADSNA